MLKTLRLIDTRHLGVSFVLNMFKEEEERTRTRIRGNSYFGQYFVVKQLHTEVFVVSLQYPWLLRSVQVRYYFGQYFAVEGTKLCWILLYYIFVCCSVNIG
ncbi:hypothetical protein Patl1_33390 [Pistacia atlantica]|uniref:Uncharacterized protein n=1 Tax=Pistacia atlantica TaxID=434234 RepID=A0ACC0ZUH6_9ROSI|nr:hypothetical protein Patl1_33390 [Pistacia atlantica]